MIKTPVPRDEAKRQKSLDDYRIVGLSEVAEFDKIVELAASICSMPVALISLIDYNREWILSKIGTSTVQVSREISFCAHTIIEPEILIVEDSRKDKRFWDNPLVTSRLNIIFYAGVPLISAEGYALGALAVIGGSPRKLSKGQQRGLQILSEQVINLFFLRRQTRTLKKLSEKVAKQYQVHIDEQQIKEIGTAAETVTTDITSPLMLIEDTLRGIKKSKKIPLDIEKGLNRIAFQTNKISQITSNLNRLSQKMQTGEYKDAPLYELIAAACAQSTDFLKKEEITLNLEIDSIIGINILCISQQLTQVFSNLLSNAAHEVTLRKPPERWIKVIVENNRDDLKICFINPSRSLSDSQLGQCFQPFFSTKNSDNNTGLGLSLSRSIAESHRGSLSALQSKDKNGVCLMNLVLKIPKDQTSRIANDKSAS